MNWKQVLAGVAVLGMVACGGGGDSGTEPTNRAPVVAFTFKPLATAKNVPVDLTITATDEDGDPLTISWTVTRGSLAAQNTKKTVMRWTVPATVGIDTVKVSVSDGSATKKLTEAIRVATVYNTGTFFKSSSPYILATAGATPRLAIPAGSALTIQPGTEIYINAAGLIVDVTGRLTAHGTLGEPIIIRHNDRSFVCGGSNDGWKGIQCSREAGADTSGIVDLSHVELWFPEDGVRLQDDSRLTMNDCSVRCSKHAGVWMEGSAVVKVINSHLTDGVGDGIAITGIASVPDTVLVQGCTLSFNNGSGIRMDLYDNSQSAVIDVQLNDFQFNSTHGISLAHSVFPQIHNNNFTGNGDSGISNLYLQSGYPGVAQACLDATCNFWGNSSQNAIDIGIHDSLDQSTVHTRVKSCPWLNSNPLTSTPNCSTPNCVSCP